MMKEKTAIKRLGAILVSLMMALVLMAPCISAEGTASITIQKPGDFKNDWAGMEIYAYRVFSQANTATADDEKLYAVEEAFRAFFHISEDAEHPLTDGVEKAFGVPVSQGASETKPVYLTYDSTSKHLVAANEAPTGPDAVYIQVSNSSALDQEYGEADLLGRIGYQKDQEGNAVIAADNGDIAIFYTWLEQYIKDTTPTETKKITAGTGTAEETIDGLEAGYYALTFSKVPTGISVIQGILVQTDSDNTSRINLKAEELPLEKTVKNSGHDGEPYGDSTTTKVGDTLDYRATSRIPKLMSAENLTKFQMGDCLENQKLTGTMTLTLSKAGATPATLTFTAEVTGEEQTVELRADDGTVIALLKVEEYADKKQNFTIDFLKKAPAEPEGAEQPNDQWKNYQEYVITLDYHAIVTGDAQRVNDNTVTLDTNKWLYNVTEATEIYTYGIEVTKTFSDNSGSYDKVTFLLKKDNSGKPGDVIGLFETATKGSYRMPSGSELTTGTTPLKLSADGKLTITGLDAGDYWLVEESTADGFNESDPIKIHLEAEKKDVTGKLTGYLDDEKTTATVVSEGGTESKIKVKVSTPVDASIALAQFEVYNQKGFTLPQTGSDGIWMFTIGGIALIAVAGILFAVSRKKNSN